MQGQYPNPENYAAKVKALYGNKADEVLQLYPGTTEQEVITSATALASDNFIAYSTWKWLDLHIQTGGKPVYAYIFSRARPAMTAQMGDAKTGLAGGIIKNDGAKKEGNEMPDALKGAGHASDIEYLLGNLKSNTVFAWTDDDYKASALGEAYFANFIKTGNPNGSKLVKWAASTKGADMTLMELNVTAKSYKETQRKRYLFLDKWYNIKK